MLNDKELTGLIIGCAIEVHKTLGPGLLESAYEACLVYELSRHGLHIIRQQNLPLIYKGVNLETYYRIDLIINQKVILELKCVNRIETVHQAQLLTYLKLSQIKYGLLLNFNVSLMKKGIQRIING